MTDPDWFSGGQRGCFDTVCRANVLAEYADGDLEKFFELLETKDLGARRHCKKRYGTYYFAWSFNIGIDDDCGKERLAYNCDSGNQYCDIYSRIPKKR